MSADRLVENLFRHEYGRLVAILSRRVGVRHIELIEDAAQSALLAALESWVRTGVPENPTAWLFRVAHNELHDRLRSRSRRDRILDAASQSGSLPTETPQTRAFLAGELREDLLRMLFTCCDDGIPVESQVVLALKTLCGFSIREIALRLFTTEANAYKRLSRARSRLRQHGPGLDEIGPGEHASRLPAVRKILYLIFTEGYLSSHEEVGIRRELCEEAIRLASVLADHPVGRDPETYALLALMHLHAARIESRLSPSGGLLLLEEQDRSRWNQDQIRCGLAWLQRSAQGAQFTRYHAEAAIAAEHCMAPSVDETRWDEIADFYQLWEAIEPSPMHRLNRAIAIAEHEGPAAGLAVLQGFEPPSWLHDGYLWAAVLADLHRRCGNTKEATRHRSRALDAAPSPVIRDLLKRRLGTNELR